MNFGRGVLIDGIDNIFEGFSKRHNKAEVYFTGSYVFPEDFSIIEGKCKVYMGFFCFSKWSGLCKKIWMWTIWRTIRRKRDRCN